MKLKIHMLLKLLSYFFPFSIENLFSNNKSTLLIVIVVMYRLELMNKNLVLTYPDIHDKN